MALAVQIITVRLKKYDVNLTLQPTKNVRLSAAYGGLEISADNGTSRYSDMCMFEHAYNIKLEDSVADNW